MYVDSGSICDCVPIAGEGRFSEHGDEMNVMDEQAVQRGYCFGESWSDD